MNTKKKVIENSFFYIFSSLLIKAMGFFLLPVFTYFLTPDDYGITNLVTGFINVATFVVALSLYSASIRFYADYKNDREKLKRLYGTLTSFIAISGSIFVVLGIIFQKFVVKIFFEGISFYPIVFVSLMILLFTSLHMMHQSVLQGMQKGKKLTIINIILFVFTALLKILFIGVFKLGALGFLLAQLVVNIIYFIYMAYDLKSNNFIKWTIDLSILKETLKYSVPLLPHNLSTRIASLTSRIFINTSGTLAEVGLYSIAMQFGNLIDIVQVSVNRAFQPWFYDMMNKNDEDSKAQAVNLSNVLLVFYSFVYVLIGLFSQEAVILMANDRYIMAWTTIPILVVGFSIKSMYYFYINVIMYYKQAARKLFIATVTGSLVDIFLAFFLVPVLGMYGSALAFVLAKIVIVAIVINLSKIYDDIGYKVLKMLGVILPSLVFMAIGLIFSYTRYLNEFNIYNTGYKVFILILYMLFIYFTNKKIIDKAIKSEQIKKMFKFEKGSKK